MSEKLFNECEERSVILMTFSKALSNNIYDFLDRQGIVTEPDKIQYGLDFLSASITKIAAVLVVGIISGTFREVTICMISFGLLRQYSGGAHMGNSKNCLFIMLGIYYTVIILSYFFNIPQIVLYGILVFVVAVIFKFAPADTEKHPIVGVKHIKRLRIKSFLVLIIGSMFAIWYKDNFAELIFLSFFIQAITLTPFVYRLTKTKRKEVTYHA